MAGSGHPGGEGKVSDLQAPMVDGSPFDRYVDDLILLQPDPPRNPSLMALLTNSYRTPIALALVAFGLVLGLAGVGVGLVGTGSAWQRAILFLASTVAIALFAGAPALRAIRYYQALRGGIRVVAEIVDANWIAPSIRPATIEAGSHGMARGVRRVLHPAGIFEEPFESDRPWAAELKVGARLILLADPRRPRVFLDLGPISVDPPNAG